MRGRILKTLVIIPVLCLFGILGAYAAEAEIGAELTIDNKVVFTFENGFNKTVSIYGTDDKDEQGKLIASGISTASGSYSYDFIEKGDTYYDYYIINTDGSNTSYTVETEYLFPRLSKEITNLKHPFVAATQDEIDRAKELIKTDEYYKAAFEKYIEQAEVYIENYKSLESTYPRGNSGNTTLVTAAQHCAVMWVLTEEEKYLDLSRHILLLITEHLQDDESMQTETKNDNWNTIPVTLTYDLIYNGLNEVDRQVIENGCLRRWADIFWSLSRGHMSNVAGANEVPLVVGLVLRDQELVDRAINRENYGFKFLLLNSINDDGSQWNFPSMYFSGRIENYYEAADWLYRSGYDMFNYKVSGTRPTAWWASSANYRDVENGDIAVVEEAYPMKTMLDFAFNYVYADKLYPVLGDTAKGSYGLDKSNILNTLEIAYKYYDDPRVSWFLSNRYGVAVPEGQPQPETQTRQKGTFAERLGILTFEPVLKGGEFVIGSEQYAEKGYSKLGNSVFNDYGQVIFRSPGNIDTSVNTSVWWKNYFEQGHGHNDALSMTMFGAGKEILFDPGSYTYGTTAHVNYAQGTAGHNVVMIDEKNYQSDAYTAEPSYIHKGFADSLTMGPYTKSAKIWSDRLYRNEENPGLITRTLWQIDDYAIDVCTAEMKGRHTFDYLLNIGADELAESTVSMTDKSGDTPMSESGGYAYIRPYKTGTAQGTWQNVYKITDAGEFNFRITMLGNEETEVVAAKAITKADTYAYEKLVARRSTEDKTTFISIFEPVAEGEDFRTVEAVPVKLKGNEIDWAQAVKLTDSETGNEDIFMYGYSYGVKEAGALISDGETSFLRRLNGEDVILGGVGMKYISGETVGMKFNTVSSAQLTKLGDKLWRLDMGEGKSQFDGKITLYGMPEGLKVYKATLSNEPDFSEIEMTGYMSFEACENGIYIIAESIEAAASAPQTEVDFSQNTAKIYDSERMLDTVDLDGLTLEALPEGLIVEAEDYTSTKGGNTLKYVTYAGDSHTTNNEYGTAFYGWDNEGYEIKWKFNVPKAGKYKIAIRYATLTEGGSFRTISVNDEEAYVLWFDATGGWGIREVAILKNQDGSDHIFELNAGENTIVMDNLSGSLNLDCFSLVEVE